MSQHTHAPWFVKLNHPQDGLVLYGSDDKEIGQVYGWHSEPLTKANAALICAAPDLLASIKILIDQISEYGFGGGFYGTHTPEMDKALAAIAKAEGK